MSKSIQIKHIVDELLADYFFKLENTKTFKKRYSGTDIPVLSNYDEQLLEERFNNSFK